MNFLKDLAIAIEKELSRKGIKTSADLQQDGLLLLARYCEHLRRTIAPAHYKVHLSQALKQSVTYQAHATAIENLARIAQGGGDLTPYQSKSIDRFEYSELLLFDWGIQHLHLGSHQKGNRFADRSGPLLFAIFGHAEAFFIAILPHGGWAEPQLLEIIDKEWPEILQPHTLNAVDISVVPTPDETIELRKAGITTVQKLSSGRIIVPPGGGITTAKTSLAAMLEAQRVARLTSALQKKATEQEAALRQALGAGKEAELHLVALNFSMQAAIVSADMSSNFVQLSL